MVERESQLQWPSLARGDHGVEQTEAESKVGREWQLRAGNLVAVCHFEDDQEQKWLVRCGVATSAVNLQSRQFVKPI